MAVDEAIAIAFSNGKTPPTLRLYSWSLPSISIGSFQAWEPGWDVPALSGKVPFVRRITGGRALLHDRELTYSVVAGTRDRLFSDGIKGTFYTIAGGFLAGLQSLGVSVDVYSPPRSERLERPSSPLCFASTSWYEITAQGKKLIGSAQRRWVGHFLQHGSLILEKRGVEGFHPSANQIGLSELLPTLPSEDTMVRAITSGFESALPIRLASGSLTPEEEATTLRLAKEKYGTDAWNLRRETPS